MNIRTVLFAASKQLLVKFEQYLGLGLRYSTEVGDGFHEHLRYLAAMIKPSAGGLDVIFDSAFPFWNKCEQSLHRVSISSGSFLRLDLFLTITAIEKVSHAFITSGLD